jgi:N-acetylneuraminic acid mutarotase
MRRQPSRTVSRCVPRPANRTAARPAVEGLECRRLMHAGHEHTVLRIDAAGSAAFTDTAGNAWAADASFTGGSANTGTFAVANTPDDALYSTRRTGVFSYAAPVENGSYKLRLLFADWHDAAGKRQFNVDVEGVRVLTNLDIAAQVGPRAALDKTFDVTVTDGTLNMAFTRGAVADPTLSGFELLPAAVQPDPTIPAAPSELYARPESASRINLAWTDGSVDETGFEIEHSTDGTTFAQLATVGEGVTAFAHQGLAAASRHVYRVRAINGAGASGWSNEAETTTLAAPDPGPDPSPGGTVLRVDAAGSGAFTDAAGKVWRSDAFFTGGSANTGTFAVAGTPDDALYSTRRTGVFSYSAAAEDGDYVLRLLFADHHTSANARRFNVDVEGARVLTNLDVVAEAGSRTALVKTFNVRITDGALDLAFTAGSVAFPTLSAFELVPAGGGGTVAVPAAPSGLDATGLTGGRIRVTWQDNASNEDNVQVERSTNGTAFKLVATLPADATSFEDPGRDPAKTYGYRVRAVNAAGASAWSNTDTTQAIPGGTTIRWSDAKSAPVPRAEAGGAAVNGKLYVFGGFTDSQLTVATRMDVYDPATNTWATAPAMPVPTTHASTAVDGNTMWVTGFFNNNGVTASRLVYKYDTVSKQWTRGPDLPAARGAGALAIVGRELHFWGGLTGRDFDAADHWRLNLDNVAAGWVTDTPLPETLNHHAGIALGGKIYSIGGMFDKQETTGNQATVRVYDPATRLWSLAKSLPSARGHIGPATFLRNGRIVIAGGSGNGVELMREVIEYDPVTNTWAQLTPLPAARKSSVAALIDGKIVVTGGNQPGVSSTTWVGV